MSQERVVREIAVKNELGLHTRPATHIVNLIQKSKSEIFFTYKKETINAKSVLNILMLAAHKDAMITIEVEGEDAEATMRCLIEAFENGFGEGVTCDIPQR